MSDDPNRRWEPLPVRTLPPATVEAHHAVHAAITASLAGDADSFRAIVIEQVEGNPQGALVAALTVAQAAVQLVAKVGGQDTASVLRALAMAWTAGGTYVDGRYPRRPSTP